MKTPCRSRREKMQSARLQPNHLRHGLLGVRQQDAFRQFQFEPPCGEPLVASIMASTSSTKSA